MGTIEVRPFVFWMRMGRNYSVRRCGGTGRNYSSGCATVSGPWTICFEATCGYGYLYRELSRLAQRVVVAHPGQLRLIFRAKRKNDRIDARKLAKLLYLDEVPTAYVPNEEVQSWRELIEHRRHRMDRQTICKNAIRRLLRSHGQIAPKGLWTKKGLA